MSVQRLCNALRSPKPDTGTAPASSGSQCLHDAAMRSSVRRLLSTATKKPVIDATAPKPGGPPTGAVLIPMAALGSALTIAELSIAYESSAPAGVLESAPFRLYRDATGRGGLARAPAVAVDAVASR